MTEAKPILRCSITGRPLSVPSANGNVSIDLIGAFSGGTSDKFARLYFRELAAPNMQFPEVCSENSWSRNVSGARILSVVCEEEDCFMLPFKGHTFKMLVDHAENELFGGKNVLLGTSNGENVAVWRDWLQWHRSKHNANAALIVDRGKPETVDARTLEFSELLQNDALVANELEGMTIVVLDFDQPLGAPDLGHEAHPIFAPDAPGKDRMAKPDADPWHSPLSFRLLYDLVHWRFLKQAKAVANLNVHELVSANKGEGTMFEAAKQAPEGVIALVGQRAYPWNLRKSVEPSFGDHICTQFDVLSRETRWCVSPAKLHTDAIWMPTRILGAKAHPAGFSFWRFMALRYCRGNEVSVGQIVPKSSLVENDELLKIAKRFGAKPKRQPDLPNAVPENEGKDAASENRVAIVTTMKNEGPFILEWVAYHRAIGVQDFLIYTNDCTDGTDDFLRLLDRKGFCDWRDNPYRNSGMKPQHAALQAAGEEDVAKHSDWLICMDVDEFIAIHTGDGTLAALFDAVPHANMISFTWRLFGSNNIETFHDGLVTQKHTSAAREFANKPHVAWGFKTLFRNNGNFKKMGVHRPKGLQPKAVDRIKWVNGSGEPMPKDQWRNAWRSNKSTYGYELASLNHYAVRSAESFLVKRDRGRVNHVDRDQGLAYWFRMNHNVVKDERMHQMLPNLRAEYEALLADPEIRIAHEKCVIAHKTKIAELKEQPKYQDFYSSIASDRMRKLSRLHGHFGTNVYLAGPSVIPDEVVDRDPSDEFFFTVNHVGDAEH